MGSVNGSIFGAISATSAAIDPVNLGFRDVSCFTVAKITGSAINGSTVTAELTASDGGLINLSGTVFSNGNQLSGTFTISGGACDGVSGNWSMSRIPIVTGRWVGTLDFGSDPPADITLSLTQTDSVTNEQKASAFRVSGNVEELSKDCLNLSPPIGGFVLGSISGTGIFFGTDASQGIRMGGHVDLAAKSMEGTFGFAGGNCAGTRGNFVLAR